MVFHEQPVLYSADLRACAAMSALDPERVTATFVHALESAGATVVQALSHNFPGAGQTCVLILAESHAILHTWPETAAVNVVSNGLFDAATATGSCAIPVTEPGPVGTCAA